MVKQTRARRVVRFALVATALLLPSATLVPLGGLYLWDKGYLTAWAIAVAAAVLAVYHLQRWLISEVAAAPLEDDHALVQPRARTAIEEKAWADVRRIATSVDIDRFYMAEAMLDVAHQTINAVAYRIHADKSDALWRFTLPEALTIIGRVSKRLNVFVTENIPFGDSLTVSQVRGAYRWRSLADAAERAYDVWRVIRLANPATAVTHEARERLSRAMLQWGREHVARRLAEAFVEEVGSAAIDLYTGRLRTEAEAMCPPAYNTDGFEHVAILPPLAEIDIAVVGEEPKAVLAILALLEMLENRRKSEVRAFIGGSPIQSTYLRRPRLVAKSVSSGSGHFPGTHEQLGGEDVLLVLLVRASGEEITAADAELVRKFAGGDISAPVLMPVIVGATDRARPDTGQRSSCADRLRAGIYSGPVADPLCVGAADNLAAEDEEAFWASIESLSDHLRRIQLVRALELSKSRRSWLGSLRQAASALGRLARHILPIGK